jgi:tetratricopeptide (TPR) repeat protein
MTDSPPAARPRGYDLLLAVLVVAFAFLAASFAARNSDLFLHLASGRLLAHGDYTFGADPFSCTTAGVYWANHAWLFDLFLYLGYNHLGGAGVVVVKALAVGCLAELLLRLSRVNGKPFWVAAGCVVLSVLAMSPRLQLQPVCLSLLLLAGCLALLRAGGRPAYLLPALVALWVNLDAWFLLGPLLVGLFILGQRLAPAGPRVPLWLLPACLLACLLSPHHAHALALPAELSPTAWQSPLRHDPRFAHLFASPWAVAQAGGPTLALAAQVVLLALGALSFAVNPAGLRDWRFVVWLAFALLAAALARAAPFFAVVAGPVAALNFADRLPAGFLLRPGRAAVTAACLALMALTWPGWLQGVRRGDRGLAWAVTPNPSLRRAANTLAGWRHDGALPAAARVFAPHPDVAHYCAWFCPGVKGFVDSRLPLFLAVADDYRQLCRLLDGGAPGPEHDLLRRHGIACAVLYDPDLRRLGPALRQAERAPDWDLLRIDGRAVAVGFRGAAHPLPAVLRFDADRLAYSPADADALPAAPDEGAAGLAQPPSWLGTLLRRPPGPSWEADAAAVYLRLFEDAGPAQRQAQARRVLGRYAAGLAGLPALPSGIAGVAARLAGGGAFLPGLDDRPPALPLLSVRAARAALAGRRDPAAWLVLAQAYRELERTTTEAATDGRLPLLARVRQVQTAAALLQAVNLDPGLAVAHEALALQLADTGRLDLALLHREAQLRLVRQARRPTGADPAGHAESLARLERGVAQMRKALQDAENRYFVHSQSLAGDPLSRARLAVQLGLSGKAVDVLLKSSPDLYGVAGLRLLLDLLLLTGRAEEARVLLDREEMRRHPDGLGWYDLPADVARPPWGYPLLAYDWFDLCCRAAAGQYGGIAVPAGRLRDRLRPPPGRAGTEPAGIAWRLASEVGLGAAPGSALPRFLRRLDREAAAAPLARAMFAGDLHVLEGMLLLESGRPTPAAAHLKKALTLYRPAGRGAGLTLARRYLQRINHENKND